MSIYAETDHLRNEARTINDAAKEYNDAVVQLFNAIEQLRSSWKGVDATMYTNRIDSHRASIEELGRVVNNYAIFANGSSDVLDETQSDISDAAGRL